MITRVLAIAPALAGVLALGDGSVGRMLVFTQVVLCAQLPFAIWPLVRFTADRELMGRHVNPRWLTLAGWALFAGITLANGWLILVGGIG